MPTVLSPALLELDQATVELSKQVHLLAALRWPDGTRERFVASWERGDPVLPEPLVARDLSGVAAELRAIAAKVDGDGPAEHLVAATAASYARSADLLSAVGTDAFSTIGRDLFGHPSESIYPGGATHLETAEHLLGLTDGLTFPVDDNDVLDDVAAVAWLEKKIARVFGDGGPRVELDPHLDALAAAGSIRVRLRAGTRYSKSQLEQLLQHEVLVHSGTKANGKAQPLGVLALSSPRTTATQEGLATLAELLTATMDLTRLRRVALRVRGLAAALDGADLVETAQIFVDDGESRDEAAASALRLFRGGDPRGRVVFLKDVVYLSGLLSVQSFLLKSFQQKRHGLTRILFAGRMTLGDAVALEPLVDEGVLHGPTVVPRWVSDPSGLSAQLALSSFHQRRNLDSIALTDL